MHGGIGLNRTLASPKSCAQPGGDVLGTACIGEGMCLAACLQGLRARRSNGHVFIAGSLNSYLSQAGL
jgi:hypothetical protein